MTKQPESDQDRMTRLSKDRYERPLPRRFYTSVNISDDNAILLDGRAVKTPMNAPFILPNRAIAELVAAEWEAQVGVINPGTMPATKYANTAIDRAVSGRGSVLDDIAQYAGSDLVCYRADRPPELVQLQSLHWNPVLEEVQRLLGTTFKTTFGIVHIAQDEAAISAVRAAAGALDPFRLTILYNLTILIGSALIALMLVSRRVSVEQGWAAAHVDEDYQISLWGSDAEATSRRTGRRLDFDALIQLVHFLG